MTKEEKQLLKIYNKTEDEKIKEVLGRLLDEDETKEEEKEEVETKQEKEETKKEVNATKVEVEKETKVEKEVGLTEERLVELLKQFGANFVTKKEVEEVKTKVEKVEKKAKPFGVQSKVEKVEVQEEPQLGDILEKLNRPFV